MKLAVVGATGMIGSAVLAEARTRGHEVVAVVRDPSKLPETVRAIAATADVGDRDALAWALAGADAVVHAYAPPRDASDEARIAAQTAGTQALISASKAAGVTRFIAVGGAGTSEIAPGVKLMDSYMFPKKWMGGARSTAVIRKLLEEDGTLDWTFVSPPHQIEPGPRTGRYRTGGDELLFDEDAGRSHISVADYAVALVDELERPAHLRARFTVGT